MAIYFANNTTIIQRKDIGRPDAYVHQTLDGKYTYVSTLVEHGETFDTEREAWAALADALCAVIRSGGDA